MNTFRTLVSGGKSQMFGALLRSLGPLLAGLFCLYLLVGRLEGIDLAHVWTAVTGVKSADWFIAVLATALSFWAIGQYDVILHRHFETGISDSRAAWSGMSAIAISQVTGLAAVVAALVRWKTLKPLNIWTIAGLTGAVSVIFMMGWALCLGFAALLPSAPLPGWVAGLAFLSLVVILALSVLRPALPGKRYSVPLPSVLHILQLVAFTAIDLTAAAVALYVLLPEPVDFLVLLPVFLIALGVGLYSGMPGGVGAFDLTLLALMTTTPETDLLAAIVAFRLVYFVLPAGVACLWMLRDHIKEDPEPIPRSVPPFPLSDAPFAEAALIRQNGGTWARYAGTTWLRVDTGQSHVHLLDPLEGSAATALPALRETARRSGRMPLLYKLSAGPASDLRGARWAVMRLSDEAVICPATFDLDVPARRQLRRKLRKTTAAGVTVRRLDPRRDQAQMAEVAASWRHAHKRERGVSMGRYCPENLRNQTSFGAFHNGQMIAFASFHDIEREMCLDLMRHRETAPDGTMSALITAAITYAKSHGIPRLSLAAAPATQGAAATWSHRAILRQINKDAGLRRFKTRFDPKWESRYVAAPNRLALVLALLDMARAVHWPDRINHS